MTDEDDLENTSWKVYLPIGLLGRLRAAVHHTKGMPGEAPSTMEFARRALLVAVKRLERKYNNGEPFPPVDRLPPGRVTGIKETRPRKPKRGQGS